MSKSGAVLCLLLMSLLFNCGIQSKIVHKPILFNAQRDSLTLEYLESRYNLHQDLPTISPRMIVLHWTEIPSFKESFEAFYNTTLPNWRPDIESVSGLNVSSHFLVDRDGTIYRLMPETKMARHVIGLNHAAIGIENVGGTSSTPLTKDQLKANIRLVKYLSKKYSIQYLIGHYEYTNFEGHPLWLEIDDGYRTEKVDPGKDFMDAVRKATKSQQFLKNPTK